MGHSNFTVLYSLVAFFEFEQPLFLPLVDLFLELFISYEVLLLQGLSGEGVSLVIEEMAFDIDPVDDVVRGRKFNWITHELYECRSTVFMSPQRYFSGISPYIY